MWLSVVNDQKSQGIVHSYLKVLSTFLFDSIPNGVHISVPTMRLFIGEFNDAQGLQKMSSLTLPYKNLKDGLKKLAFEIRL